MSGYRQSELGANELSRLRGGMRQFDDEEELDAVVVGNGAGG